MGIVRRQSLLATFSSYLGGALGFVNKAILFTRILSLEGGELGFVNLLLEISTLFAQLALLGISNSTLRFFPYFEDKQKGHNGILAFGLIVVTLGSLLAIGALAFFKQLITEWLNWKGHTDLLIEYYAYLFPLVGATAVAYLLTAYLRSTYNIFVPTFIREIVIRIFVSLSVTAYALDWINFPQFVKFYTLINCSAALFLLAYTAYKGQLKLIPKDWRLVRQYAPAMLNHGVFVMLGGLSFVLVLKLDAFMLYFLKDLQAVGIYTTIVYFTIVMEYPYRALVAITSPKIAEMWKTKDIKGIEKLYKRTSLLNFAVAIPIFFSIWINLDSIFEWVMNDKNGDFASGIYVFLYLGIARVIHMLTGLNAAIIYTSSSFRYDLFFNLGLLLLAFILNFWLIPIYGIDGAAIATAISMISYNLIRVAFIYYKEQIHPFSSQLIGVLLIGLLVYGLNLMMPFVYHYPVDIIIRSSLFVGLYGGMLWGFRLVPDINDFGEMLLRKFTSSNK